MSFQIVNSASAPEPIGPYNQATIFGDLIFVSGQIGFDPFIGDLVNETIEQETGQVMTNLSAILEASNSDFSKVLKATIFLKDLSDYDNVNRVYGSFFNDQAPARECVEVSRLPKDVNVEISLIAFR